MHDRIFLHPDFCITSFRFTNVYNIVLLAQNRRFRMKKTIQFLLQQILGFHNYLFVFSLYIFTTLKQNRKEGDFLYFLSMLQDKTAILDIGANIGVMTTHLARKYRNSQVFAFEPVPDNMLTIRRMIKFFNLKNVQIFNCALGSADGKAEIVLPLQHKVKMQGLSHIEGVTGEADDNGIRFHVEMRQLDKISEIAQCQMPVSGIKIDVENYEYEVLKGAQALIFKHMPVIYAELWDNPNRASCFELLTGLGYNIKVLSNGNLVTFEPSMHHVQNFFFVPAGI